MIIQSIQFNKRDTKIIGFLAAPTSHTRTRLYAQPVPTALVLSETNLAHELGYVEDWLLENKFTIERIYRDDLVAGVPFPPADLLINMGSLSSVASGYAQEAALLEIDLVKDWTSQGKNYIGLCFGAQVLAVALGGHVTRQAAVHKGVEEIDFITDAPGAIIDSEVSDAILIFHNGNAWGVQPHVELTPETLERMAIKIGVPQEDYAPLVTQLGANATIARASTLALLDHIRLNQA
jgi:GMP synthase-like glutamine amidotransferase